MTATHLPAGPPEAAPAADPPAGPAPGGPAPGGPAWRAVPIGLLAATLYLTGAPRRLPRPRLARPVRRSPRLAAAGHAAAWPAAWVTLFVVYLHVARTVAVTSDGASNVLQAWDMLHGNLLLRGWQLSDVSFYPTELPQYALIEAVRGLSAQVVPIASAMTYSLLALLAALLAKGRATGRDAVVRCMIAVGIMAAPQPGDAVYVLLGSPDHIGSTVPVLAAFLLLDRAPRRWWVPPAAAAMLAWGLAADDIVLVTGVLPVLAVCLARGYGLVRLGRRGEAWFEAELAAAAIGAVWAARAGVAAVTAHGGFTVWPVRAMFVPAAGLPHSLLVAGEGLLLLFGADFLGRAYGLAAGLAAVHLAGLVLAAWGCCAVLRRFRAAGLAGQLLAVGAVATLAAYALSTRASGLLSARDITAVLPFGAALAGRLSGRLSAAGLLPALAAVLACYLAGLGIVVAAPPARQPDAALAGWLASHHLDYGLADYWDANVTTVQTAGRVRLRAIAGRGSSVSTGYWETRPQWYAPAANYANFVVLSPGPSGSGAYPTIASVRAAFGQPARIYGLGRYTILIWDKNLLAGLIRGSPPQGR